MFTACTGHTDILGNWITERTNLRAFIRPPALLLAILAHPDCFFHALKCPLIIGEVDFTLLFATKLVPLLERLFVNGQQI